MQCFRSRAVGFALLWLIFAKLHFATASSAQAQHGEWIKTYLDEKGGCPNAHLWLIAGSREIRDARWALEKRGVDANSVELYGRKLSQWSDDDVRSVARVWAECFSAGSLRLPAPYNPELDIREILAVAKRKGLTNPALVRIYSDRDASHAHRLRQWRSAYDYVKGWWETLRGGIAQEVFQCDYTSRTCVRGYAKYGSGMTRGQIEAEAYEVLEEDRTTIVDHLSCRLVAIGPDRICRYHDAGYSTYNGRPLAQERLSIHHLDW